MSRRSACLSALVLLFLASLLSACATPSSSTQKPTDERDNVNLVPASFQDLVGWEEDQQGEALRAFRLSCARHAARAPSTSLRHVGEIASLQKICMQAEQVDILQHTAARTFFEKNFDVFLVKGSKGERGLFTGYYEPLLKGSYEKIGPYQTPLYARPDDLVMVDLGEFRSSLKGQRIAGRVKDGRLRPFEDRAKITDGKTEKPLQPILYVDGPIDAFFLEIQGSGRIQMPDGSIKRLGFAGQNGHPYVAIGKILADRGDLKREEVSLATIRAWLLANPDKATQLLNENPSYVFFRPLDENGAIGAEGTVLTSRRSLAVDSSYWSYGLPFWLDTEDPDAKPFRQLMVAQDTGGAIRGVVRGDVFFGDGDVAEDMAGRMKSQGRYFILLPKQVIRDTGLMASGSLHD
jgi:membrane-bound lytic murein transglycosylase A